MKYFKTCCWFFAALAGIAFSADGISNFLRLFVPLSEDVTMRICVVAVALVAGIAFTKVERLIRALKEDAASLSASIDKLERELDYKDAIINSYSVDEKNGA